MHTLPFESIHRHGLVRVASCTPRVEVADPRANVDAIIELADAGHTESADLMVYPELCVSAYAIDDLLLQDALLAEVDTQLARLVAHSTSLQCVLIVGAPLRRNSHLFNCAVVIARGRILGVVPKSFLPNYREYYEKRWFSSGAGHMGMTIECAGQSAPFGVDLIFRAANYQDFVFHVEICEDFWAATPPSTRGALAGALILCNLSASNIVIGKADERALLCASQSVRCHAAYIYAAAGPGESTTDMAWDGQASIHELGLLLACSDRFPLRSQMTIADVERLRLERMRTPTYADAATAAALPENQFRVVNFDHPLQKRDVGLRRIVDRFPYVPDDASRLDRDCYEAFNIQTQGLIKRLRATGTQRVVIGISGGLDSTHALLVAAKAFDLIGLPRANILAFTMPGFATGDATKANAWKMMTALHVTGEEIDIRPAALRMLQDLGHPYARGEAVYDVTFENVQAGLRSDYLFRLANQRAAMVLGTSDLSELALGWCTYGIGDHMSHYNVNGSLAKTLIQHLIRWVIQNNQFDAETSSTLQAVLDTHVSPELIPAGQSKGLQSTEEKIGPYELQDFNLYHITRFGLRPSKVAFLAWHAWREIDAGSWPPGLPQHARHRYDLADIRQWLIIFLQRFFALSQFKRSALPNSPKVMSGANLSPRSDWRAPSDGNARVWLAELEANVPQTVERVTREKS